MNDIHAGDIVLNSVTGRFAALYGACERMAEDLLAAFLSPKLAALRPRRNETARAFALRFMAAFVGRKWTKTRKMIAEAFTDANEQAARLTNDGLDRALADGLNDAAYTLALDGANVFPITDPIVARLKLSPKGRKVNRRKDVAYNVQRTQTAVHSAIFQGVKPDKLPGHVARAMASARRRESVATARAAIYGASDYGAYLLGIEAERSGISVEKTWIAIMDARVRASHKALHGTTIPIDEVFHGRNGTLRFPHDPQAHPAEVYNCRCRMAVHIAGKAPPMRARTILPSQTADYKKWRAAQIRKLGGELELEKLHRRLVG